MEWHFNSNTTKLSNKNGHSFQLFPPVLQESIPRKESRLYFYTPDFNLFTMEWKTIVNYKNICFYMMWISAKEPFKKTFRHS